jgi:ATP-dependent Clp protease protease subunit
MLLILSFTLLSSAANGDESERLRKTRDVQVVGVLDDKLATETIAKLLFLDSLGSDRPVTLTIASSGGGLESLIAILDTLRDLHSPVQTRCRGRAEGSAAVLLASGHRGDRVASPACLLSFAGLGEDSRRLKARQEILRRLAVMTGKPPAQISVDTVKARRFLPREAIDYGLVDLVRGDSPEGR